MRNYLALLILSAILMAACAAGLGSSPTLPQQGAICGDGLCDGPENAENCPGDCAMPGAPTIAEHVPPLYFFYAIHTHVSGDTLPYDENMVQIDPQVAENMIAAIEGIREILDRYGIPGSWQVTYGIASGLCDYGGEDNILSQLLDDGHEVAMHAHRTEDISTTHEALTLRCGITPTVGSGHLLDAYRLGQIGGAHAAQDSMTISLGISSGLGVNIITENLSPGGGKSIFDESCDSQLGIGNTMWEQSGNLMFPWRPDYQHGNICAHNPQSDVLFIDHVSPEFALSPMQTMPDVWGPLEFSRLQQFFDGALAYMQTERPDRIAVWGFATHITEYAIGSHGENPPDPASLAALDQFLAYVDSKHAQGLVQYATPAQIAELVGQ